MLFIGMSIFGNINCCHTENGMMIIVICTHLAGVLEADIAGSMSLQHQKPSQKHVGTETRVPTLCDIIAN